MSDCAVTFKVTWKILWGMLVAILTTGGMVRMNVDRLSLNGKPLQGREPA